jgi:hypothetical protein
MDPIAVFQPARAAERLKSRALYRYKRFTFIPFSRYKKSSTYTANTAVVNLYRYYTGKAYTRHMYLYRYRHSLVITRS